MSKQSLYEEVTAIVKQHMYLIWGYVVAYEPQKRNCHKNSILKRGSKGDKSNRTTLQEIGHYLNCIEDRFRRIKESLRGIHCENNIYMKVSWIKLGVLFWTKTPSQHDQGGIISLQLVYTVSAFSELTIFSRRFIISSGRFQLYLFLWIVACYLSSCCRTVVNSCLHPVINWRIISVYFDCNVVQCLNPVFVYFFWLASQRQWSLLATYHY